MNEKKLCQESFVGGMEYDLMGHPVKFHQGMSKRLLLAGMAMQGLLANSAITVHFASIKSSLEEESKGIAKASFMVADELLRQESETDLK